MTSQSRALGGLMPPGAIPGIGWAIRTKTTAPFSTEWYQAQATVVTSVAGKAGDVVLTHTDISDWASALSSYAPLNSPALTGIPTAPTATVGTSNTQVASTAFVAAAVVASTTGVASWNARTGAVTFAFADITAVFAAGATNPAMDGVANPGVAVTWSRSDHVHPSDTSRLALSGGTMTGNLILAADPVSPLGAMTKQYIDNLTIDCGTY